MVSTSSTDGENSTNDGGTIELVVGRIGKPHGIKGEVTVDVRTDEPERRFATGATLRAETPRGSASTLTSMTVTKARWHQSTLLVTFAELHDRNSAEAARGIVLHATVPADEAPEDPDEFYDHQLAGLRAVTVDGAEVGVVSEVLHLPSQDLLALRRPDGREALVPFVTEIVPEVDLAGGRVVLDPPPGLLDDLPEE